jgi:hypothetical protein
VLGGCGGCVVIVIIGMVAAGLGFANMWKGASKDLPPITPQNIQQLMGEVPLYPGSTLDATTTQIVWGGVRMGEKAAGKPPGSIFKVVAVCRTQDPPDKILEYYDQTLKGAGWQPAETKNNSGREQKVYRKGQDVVMVQVQEQPGQGTMITLMRGGPDLMKQAPASR